MPATVEQELCAPASSASPVSSSVQDPAPTPHPRPPRSIPPRRSRAKSSASSRTWAPVFIARNPQCVEQGRHGRPLLQIKAPAVGFGSPQQPHRAPAGPASRLPRRPSPTPSSVRAPSSCCSRRYSCSSGVDEADSSLASPASCTWASQPQPSYRLPSRPAVATNPPRRLHLLRQRRRARTPMAKLRRSFTLAGVLLLAAASAKALIAGLPCFCVRGRRPAPSPARSGALTAPLHLVRSGQCGRGPRPRLGPAGSACPKPLHRLGLGPCFACVPEL